jgi:tetratricopeptide (TPR) repeat protein
MRGEFDSSITYFDRAIEEDPGSSDAYFNRGAAKGNLKRHEEAIPDLDRAISLNSVYPEAYYVRAVSKIHLGQRESACEDLRTALEQGYAAAAELIATHCSTIQP